MSLYKPQLSTGNVTTIYIKILNIVVFFCRVFQKMLYQAPSPQRKKEPAPRENKLRLFLKRSSEPLLNLQNSAQQVMYLLTVPGYEIARNVRCQPCF